jgi:hypothetical protein
VQDYPLRLLPEPNDAYCAVLVTEARGRPHGCLGSPIGSGSLGRALCRVHLEVDRRWVAHVEALQAAEIVAEELGGTLARRGVSAVAHIADLPGDPLGTRMRVAIELEPEDARRLGGMLNPGSLRVAHGFAPPV